MCLIRERVGGEDFECSTAGIWIERGQTWSVALQGGRNNELSLVTE